MFGWTIAGSSSITNRFHISSARCGEWKKLDFPDFEYINCEAAQPGPE